MQYSTAVATSLLNRTIIYEAARGSIQVKRNIILYTAHTLLMSLTVSPPRHSARRFHHYIRPP
jgi:hypothetical protein